jgi:predicted  nucleic acid-binding Zn-ribbon protein
MWSTPNCPRCPTKAQWLKYKAVKLLYKDSGIKIHDIHRKEGKLNSTIYCTCLKCGHTWEKPLSQIIQPCKECKVPTIDLKKKRNKISNTASLDVREQQMIEIVKEKFLDKIKVLNHTSKGTSCKCTDCGYEWTTNYLLQTKHGCPECAATFRGTIKYTNSQYNEVIILLHNVKSLERYVNLTTVIQHSCLVCKHKFKLEPNKVLKQGCANCSPKKSKLGPHSDISQIWLRILEKELKLRIQRSETSKEYRIPIGKNTAIVDGYSKDLNMIFEFLGSYWHGDPNVKIKTKAIPPRNKRNTPRVLFSSTMKRLTKLTMEGYNVCYVWESQFVKGQMLSGVLYAAER